VSAAACPALVSIVRPQIDRHQHQARPMGHRGQKRPKRQTRWRDAGQKPGMATIDQQVDPQRDQQGRRADLDLALPFHQKQKHCERKQDRGHGHQMADRKRQKRLVEAAPAPVHQRRRNGKRPAHAGIDPVIQPEATTAHHRAAAVIKSSTVRRTDSRSCRSNSRRLPAGSGGCDSRWGTRPRSPCSASGRRFRPHRP
jgi:hypothetical protein